MDSGVRAMAPCGLLCGECDIFKATTDDQLKQQIIAWLEGRGHKNIDPRSVGCHGCPGDGGLHWSADCGILKCNRDRGFRTCNQCPEFECERLSKWGAGGQKYAEALARLRGAR